MFLSISFQVLVLKKSLLKDSIKDNIFCSKGLTLRWKAGITKKMSWTLAIKGPVLPINFIKAFVNGSS